MSVKNSHDTIWNQTSETMIQLIFKNKYGILLFDRGFFREKKTGS
jgi:hypothetical protein